MVQVFQKSEKYDAADYTIVSLTCTCCKSLTHMNSGGGYFSSKIYDIRDDLDFDIKIPFLEHGS